MIHYDTIRLIRAKEQIFESFMLPVLEYGNIVYDSALLKYLTNLDKVQKRKARACTRAYKRTESLRLYEVGMGLFKTKNNI